MHGLEVEKINYDQFIIPFVGKEKPWWSDSTNRNIFTGENFKMVPTIISDREITVEDIEVNTNVSNIIVEKLPYYTLGTVNTNEGIYTTKFNPSEDVFYLARPDINVILNPQVTKIYEIIQHKEVLNRAETLRSEFPDKLQYYSSGVLFQGKMFWVQLEQKKIEVIKGDELLLTLMFLSNNKGANAIYSTITRVVCDNTLKMSLSNFNQRYLINHKGNTEQSYDNLMNSFNVEDFKFQETVELYQYWNSIDLNSKEIVELIRYSLDLEDIEHYDSNYLFRETMRLLEEQKGVELLRGKYSAYRVFNALTEVTHYLRGANKIYDSIFGKVNNISKRFNEILKRVKND